MVNGASRFIGDIEGTNASFVALNLATSSGSTVYGPGTSGQFITSNGNAAIWSTIDGSTIIGSNAIGSNSQPIYWNGSAFANSSQVFVAEYNVTSYQDIKNAVEADKIVNVYYTYDGSYFYCNFIGIGINAYFFEGLAFGAKNLTRVSVNSANIWTTENIQVDPGLAGASNSGNKLYLIGAAEQGSYTITNSHSSVYMQNGTLYATVFNGNGAALTALNASNISTGTLNRPLNYNISTNVTFNATKHDATTSPSAVSYNNTSNQSIDLGYYITASNSNNVGAVTGTTSTTTSSLTISLNGTSQGAWNGSSSKSINITPTAIGAASLASPGFTGVPTAPTAAVSTNSTQIATTAFVQAAIQAAIANAVNASY